MVVSTTTETGVMIAASPWRTNAGSGTHPSGSVHHRFIAVFFAQGGLFSGSRLPPPPPPSSRRRHRNEPRVELLRLQKTYPSRNGLPAMPSQLLNNRVTSNFGSI